MNIYILLSFAVFATANITEPVTLEPVTLEPVTVLPEPGLADVEHTQQTLTNICVPTPFIRLLPSLPYMYIPAYEFGYKCFPMFGIDPILERFCEPSYNYTTTVKRGYRIISRRLHVDKFEFRTVMNHTKCVFRSL